VLIGLLLYIKLGLPGLRRIVAGSTSLRTAGMDPTRGLKRLRPAPATWSSVRRPRIILPVTFLRLPTVTLLIISVVDKN
jgi:hypothetical protein